MDPLSAATTIAAATRSVGAWVGRVMPEGGFAALLEGPDPGSAGTQAASGPEAPSGLQTLRDRLQQAVDDTLRALGITTATPLQLTAGSDGRMRVQNEHPRGAEIEAALAGRDDLAPLAAQLARQSGGAASWTWPSLTTSPGFPYTMR